MISSPSKATKSVSGKRPFEPCAKTPDNMMMNDMLCHMTEGELAVVQNGKPFTVKQGGVWTCAKGITTEGTQNKGSTVAVMRIIDLLPA
jgi:hypothetical protein